jgi:outer membrane protein OmpA-like peptidoglycan-associated protein
VAEISVEGYAMNDGGLEAKRDAELSAEREEAVRSYLAKGGYFAALAEQPKAVGRGVKSPAAGNDTLEGRKRNRRVELVISLN